MNELTPYLRLLAAHRGRLATGAILMLATVAAGVGLLALSGWFITATGVTAMLLAAGATARLDIYMPGAGIRFFALARTAARYFERVHNHDVVLRLLADLRTRVFARLTPLDPASLARFRGALLLNRLTADIDALDNLYLRCLAPPAVGLLGVLGVSVLLAIVAPVAGLAAGGLLLLAGTCVTAGTAWPGARLGERITERTESARIRIVDLVRGLAELRAFGVLDRWRRDIDHLDDGLVTDQMRAARLAAGGEALMGLAVHSAVALALLLGITLYTDGVISGPLAALMPLAVLALAEGLAPIPGGLLQLGRTRAAARRLNAQIATEATIVDPVSPCPAPARNDLAIDGVRVHHGETIEPVFAGLSLHIPAGSRLAVVGPSGCGKSTLADLCARLVEPDSGEVRLGGVPLPQMALADVHARVSYLTQRTEMFADTIAANLRIAHPDARDDALRHAVEVARLTEFIDGLDDGLATWIGEGGVRLSGGQARRLALARIVLRDAPVVLLDEPLSGLDRQTADDVSSGLHAWLGGRTVLMLAHATDALPPADEMLDLGTARSTDL